MRGKLLDFLGIADKNRVGRLTMWHTCLVQTSLNPAFQIYFLVSATATCSFRSTRRLLLSRPGSCFLSYASGMAGPVPSASWQFLGFASLSDSSVILGIKRSLSPGSLESCIPRVELQNVSQDLRRRSHRGSRQRCSCSSQACPPRREINAFE